MIEIDSLGQESIRNLAFHRRHEIIVQTHKDGDITNPITMNGHNYANNNPVIIVDPNVHIARVIVDEGEKNIEDIEVGDMVVAKSEFDENGELAYKEVTALIQITVMI